MTTLLLALISGVGFAGLAAYARGDRFAGPAMAERRADDPTPDTSGRPQPTSRTTRETNGMLVTTRRRTG